MLPTAHNLFSVLKTVSRTQVPHPGSGWHVSSWVISKPSTMHAAIKCVCRGRYVEDPSLPRSAVFDEMLGSEWMKAYGQADNVRALIAKYSKD